MQATPQRRGLPPTPRRHFVKRSLTSLPSDPIMPGCRPRPAAAAFRAGLRPRAASPPLPLT
ncbi:hypothetical protein CBM2587_A30108 [Cupriavidus taiwanensis]|uniref:Uncharacterized protein n=1 Tax=Cupriavidus taiwanensis TaxID=164546 RepID=A0A375BTR9_9BURK|nr:hypothetical protein CBM2587_A30108 [Cupriavidus taiwanensis]